MPEQQLHQPNNNQLEDQEEIDHLFSKSKPDSILFKYKQVIISNGLKAGNDFVNCLKFIKGLSASKNFEYALKEQQKPPTSSSSSERHVVVQNHQSRKGKKNRNRNNEQP